MAHLVLIRLVRRRCQLLLQRSSQLGVWRASALLLASTAVAARDRGGRPKAVAWMGWGECWGWGQEEGLGLGL